MYALCFSTPRSRFPFHEGDRVDLLCTVDVNEFRDVRCAQLIVQDFKPSRSYADACEKWHERYREVRAGGAFDPEEGFVPERPDFAHVYTVLRREFRSGRDSFTEQELLSLVNGGAPRSIHYVCLKYILEVFHELRICGVEETAQGYRFDVYFNASKTNIEKSSILKKLKSQCRKG